ncbi:MAG: peptidase [Chthonomonadales bacterium]|nr:peptidase [Chthonomonadales bacterium]
MPFSFLLTAGRSRCGLRSPLLFVSLCTLGFASGCLAHPPHALSAVSARAAAAAPSAIAQVQSSPLYRQARQDCAQRNYLYAATRLMELAQTPGLAPEAAAFVEQQRQLCLSEAHVSAPKNSTVPSAPAPSPADADCGPRALLLLCQQLGVKTNLETLRQSAGTTAEGTTMEGLQLAAQKLGLKAEGVQVSREALPNVSLPAIAWDRKRHFLAVMSAEGTGDRGTACIHDPNHAQPETISQESLLQRSGGYLLLIRR